MKRWRREREREREERKLLGNLSTLGRDAASLPPFIPMQTWEESKTVYKKPKPWSGVFSERLIYMKCFI
jgi:hypothetical protein